MELIISILILFVAVNCLLKLSFWKGWQAALFGLICGVFVMATYPYSILQSKTQLADYLQNTTMLKNMAVIVTLESTMCFAYCISVLQGAERQKWWMKMLKWYPGLLVFPILFYLQTELVFAFPGTDFSTISCLFTGVVLVLVPLLRRFFRSLLPEDGMRLEIHFLVSLFVCIIGLLTTVNGHVTYQGVCESQNWKALAFAFGLFLVLFLAGAGWSRAKWPLLQKIAARRSRVSDSKSKHNR